MALFSESVLAALNAGDSVKFEGGTCTKWDATSYENTVVHGRAVYENCAVVNPAAMAAGLSVLLLKTPSGRIILGPLVRANAAESGA